MQSVLSKSALNGMQTEPMPNMPEAHNCGTAPSQHSAPAMPSEPHVTSPHRQLPGEGAGSQQPPGTAAPADVGARDNRVHNLSRWSINCLQGCKI